MRERLTGFLAAGLMALSTAVLTPAAYAAKPGGTINVGLTQAPRHVNAAVQSGMATAIPSAQVFASLLRFDEDWNPQPYLATEWAWEDDGKALRVHLHKDAVFHDGTPITAEDVAFSIMAAKANHPFKTMFEVLEEVETPDEHTVVFRLSQPHPALLVALSPALSPILPKHIYDDGQDLNTHPRNVNDVVGSGPFKFKSFVPGKEVILERFDDFFIEDRPYADRLVIQINQDITTLFLGAQQGNIHLVPFAGDAATLQMADADPAVQLVERGYEGAGSLTLLSINTAKAPLDNEQVRQAIAYALDKDFLVDALAGGFSQRSDGPLHSASPMATDNLVRYEQDLDKAKQLLDEAGHPEDEDGWRFTLTVDSLPGSQMNKNLGEYIRQQLRKIGIQADLRTSADFPAWAERIASHDFHMTTDNIWNWGDPVIGVHRSYLSSNIKNIVWTNTQSYENERVDELLAQAAVTLDEDERKALYEEFQQIITTELPIIFVVETPFRTIAAKNVKNIPQTVWGPLSPMDEVYVE